MLGCIPDIYKACTCPSLRPKKEPAVCNRNMDGLMKGDLTSLKQGSGATPHCVWQTAGRSWQWSLLLGEGEIDSYRGI